MQKFKAIKYIRLSYTDDKTVESNSVSNQRKLIDDFLAQHAEIEVVCEKVDDGYSGVLFDRPAFKEMMELVKSGAANCVIVKDLSRLGREYIETGRYLRRVFPAYGVRFIAINDNVDTLNDEPDDLTVSVKNIINEAYSRDISVKTRTALDIKRRSGDFVGAFTVYGYLKTGANKDVCAVSPKRGTDAAQQCETGDKHKSLIVDPFAANVVRDIFRKRLDGFSAYHIAEELNKAGILSPLAYKRSEGLPYAKGGYADTEDCKWSATTILRILSDEIYTGTMVQGKQTTPHFKLKERELKPSEDWVRVENTHEAIIDKADFDLVQRLKGLDTRTAPQSDKVYLFSGVLICGCCGGRMTRKINRSNGKEYVYYYCPTGKKGGCKSSSMIKESELTECVQSSLKAHINSVVSLNSVITSVSRERINQGLVQEYTSYIKSNEEQLARVESFKRMLYENLVGGALSKEEFFQYKQEYSAKAEEIKEAIQNWNEKLSEVLENRGERNRWLNHFLRFAEMEKIDRSAVSRLIQSIKINADKRIEVRFSYQDEYQKAVAFIEQISDERRAG